MAQRPIQALSNQVPGQDPNALKQAKAAGKIQLQQALGAAPTTTPAAKAAAELAPKMATAEAGLTREALAKQQQQLAAVKGQELQSKERADVLAARKQKLAAEKEIRTVERQRFLELADEQLQTKRRMNRDDMRLSRDLTNIGLEFDDKLFFLSDKQSKDLAGIARDLEGSVFRKRAIFARDELGRKFTNEVQLSDYVVINAKNDQDFKNRMQVIKQAHDFKIQLLEFAHKSATEILTKKTMLSQLKLDKAAEEELLNYADDLKRKLEREKNNGQMMTAMLQGTLSIAGGVLGGIYGGGPVGATAGASAGGALGGAIGGAQ